MTIDFASNELDSEPPDEIVAAMVSVPLRRTCSPFSTVTEAVMILKDEDCDMIPVVDQGRPVGIVTDRDLALAVVEFPELAVQPVSKVMSRAFATVTRDTPGRQVVKEVVKSQAQTIFVVDANGRAEGLISWSDLARKIPEVVMTEIYEPAVLEVEAP